MEAIRPASEHHHQPSESLIDLTDALPPPPAPFPAYHTRQDGHAPPPAIVQITERELSTLQTTCVAALTSLLPSQHPSSDPTLAERDRPIAAALTELLETTYELDSFRPSPAYEEVDGSSSTSRPSQSGTEASFAALAQHLANLQPGLAGGGRARSRESLQPAIDVYRQEVAMERVQTLSRVVLGMVRAREVDSGEAPVAGADTAERSDESSPRYSADQKRTSDDLPDYLEPTGHVDSKDAKSEVEAGPSSPLRPAAASEKMLHDLDNLTSAIERLNSLSAQYSDQRSVLRPLPPRSASPIRTLAEAAKGKGRAGSEKAKMKELEDIWRQIERSHGKRRMLDDQRIDLEGVQGRRAEGRSQFLQELYERAETSRLKDQEGQMRAVDGDLARARELRDRDRFLRDLLEVSAGARLGDQDASLPDQEAMRARQLQAHHAFVQDLMGRMQTGRLDRQDYPISPETRIQDQRQQLVDSLVSFSSSGRMADQDSAPPTPRQRDVGRMDDPTELVTMETFFKDGPQIPVGTEVRKGRSRPSSAGNGGEDEKKVGTFGKIKGMMRRKSVLSLGLSKPVKETDLSQVNYLAEHQENLNIVTVTLFGPNLPITSDFQLKSYDPAPCSLPAVEAILQKDDLTLRIPMPVPILSHQSAPLTTQGSHLEAKFASVPMATFAPTLISSVSHPLSASELRELEPRGMCCTTCDREVAAILSTGVGDAGRFKDLPGEYWAEMMEVWMCHDDPGFTARLASQTKEGFWPAKGKVLVGGSYLLVNSADVKRANVIQQSSKDTNWNVVSCPCGEILGKARKEDGKPGAGTVRFSKWAMALLREDDVDGEKVENPLGVYVTADMLDLAQAHATFRFLIVDEEDEEHKILIWLFNPSIRISYRRTPPSIPTPSSVLSPRASSRSRKSSLASRCETNGTAASTQSLRACKIMYRQLGPGSWEGATQGQGQVEELKYPSLVVDRLLEELRVSTEVYPQTRRKMGAWEVGFLGRV